MIFEAHVSYACMRVCIFAVILIEYAYLPHIQKTTYIHTCPYIHRYRIQHAYMHAHNTHINKKKHNCAHRAPRNVFQNFATYVQACIYAYTHTHRYTHGNWQHACKHTFMHITYTFIHANAGCLRLATCMHAYIHAHIHADTHKCIHTRIIAHHKTRL